MSKIYPVTKVYRDVHIAADKVVCHLICLVCETSQHYSAEDTEIRCNKCGTLYTRKWEKVLDTYCVF